MPRPRRFHLFPSDAEVVSVAAEFHRAGQHEFFGLELAKRLGRERSSVYKSLHRLVKLGLLEERWEERRCYYRLTQFGRESVSHARHGARVFGRYKRRQA
jgi:DNA-binding MarR family transcriptional regulator